MAEEKMDQTPNEEPQDNGNGDNGSSTNGDTIYPDPQTRDCFKKYIEDPLNIEIKTAKSDELIACIDYKGKIKDQKYSLCSLIKAREFEGEYFKFKNYISTTFLSQSCLVDENVDSYIAKTNAIKQALDSSLNGIKEAKSKLWKIRECACKLQGAANDSCNSEQLSALNQLPAGPPNGETGKKRFLGYVDELVKQANSLYDAIDDTFEKGIKVAGIQAYMNTSSLKDFSVALKTDATGLDTNVDETLTYADAQIDAAQEIYTNGLKELDNCLFKKNESHLDHLSLEATVDSATWAMNSACEDMPRDLSSICEAVEALFNDGICPQPS